jgi:hypothetical protein
MSSSRLIAFLEQEAAVLRHRIADLHGDDILIGVSTPDGTPSASARSEAEARALLAEIEEHLQVLRSPGGIA